MSTNRILALGAVALLLYLGFSYGLRAAFPCTEVGCDTAVSGRITGAFQRKKSRTFFLDGKLDRRYDFDAFAPATGPAEEDNPLSQYLRKGDLVSKSGRAALLTVQRGDTLTRWVCSPSPAVP
ncbi:hypothetical protein [Hymenobacter properus]|uniref:Uncharacterized protein n=1 Tax=Hymenobacter properus TaxID=2791026 RepID=A0A931FIH6_9BACT|nr:hypothetical protein [Hymenobacter properus]MBF9140803.1 hypothetical protein [Hymenobacter properus]MBR7719612.1 hypothetical protein [Microvirga sp. SRT04]